MYQSSSYELPIKLNEFTCMKTIIITLERQREIANRKIAETKIVAKPVVKPVAKTATKKTNNTRRPNYNAVETKNYASSCVKNITSKLNNEFDEMTMKNCGVYFTNQHTNDFEIVFVDKLNRCDFHKKILVNDDAMIDKIYQSIKKYIVSKYENKNATIVEQKLAA